MGRPRPLGPSRPDHHLQRSPDPQVGGQHERSRNRNPRAPSRCDNPTACTEGAYRAPYRRNDLRPLPASHREGRCRRSWSHGVAFLIRIELALQMVPGVVSARASLETNAADIEYQPEKVDFAAVGKAIEAARYTR